MESIKGHPWVTVGGTDPTISTEDNLYYLGKHVEEPTQEELGNAIGSIRGLFTVVRAVQKMRRLNLKRRTSGQSASPLPSPGEEAPNPSHQSSMDSYGTVESTSASDSRPGETDASTVDDGEQAKYAEMLGEHDRVMSPLGSFAESDVGTQRQDSGGKQVDAGGMLKIDTALENAPKVKDDQGEGKEQDDDDVEIFESPVSDADMPTPVATGEEK